MKFLLLLLALCSFANADEFGLRVDSAIDGTNTSVVQFPPGDINGKMIHLVYDWEPHKNFYMEGALGYRSWNDIFEYSSAAYEVSTGFRITAGYLVLKLSEGLAYMPENSFDPVTFSGYQKWDFVIHLTVGLKDPSNGIGVYLDRSHYSNGYADDNPSLNYTGFMLQFPLPGGK